MFKKINKSNRKLKKALSKVVTSGCDMEKALSGVEKAGLSQVRKILH